MDKNIKKENKVKAKKALVIYAHPYDGSFCHAVKEQIIQILTKNKTAFNLIDLYEDKFNPVMSSEDLRLYSQGGFTDPKVEKYLSFLSETNIVYIVFPVWWGVMPAILKGFFDKVLLPQKAYVYQSSGLLEPLFSQIKKAVIFNTLGGPKIYHNLILRFPVKRVVAQTTLKMIGVKNFEIVQFASMKKSSEKLRLKWLDKTANIVSKNSIQ